MLEAHLEKSARCAQIVLMDLTKASGRVNRTILRATLYEIGLPGHMIAHIRRGHMNTQLPPKTKGKYGNATPSNVGVFQVSAVSALLFAIDQDDMMEDYDALSRESHIPLKHTMEWETEEIDQQVQNEIRQRIEGKTQGKKSISSATSPRSNYPTNRNTANDR